MKLVYLILAAMMLLCLASMAYGYFQLMRFLNNPADRALQSIEDVTNPLLNSINEKCARIRRTFVTMLDSSVAEQYYIKGARGNAKKITLPRELVAWE